MSPLLGLVGVNKMAVQTVIKPCVACGVEFKISSPSQLYCHRPECEPTAQKLIRQTRTEQARQRYHSDRDRQLAVIREYRRGKGRGSSRAATKRYASSEKGAAIKRQYASSRYAADKVRAAYLRLLAYCRFEKIALPLITLEQYRILVETHLVCDICAKGDSRRLCLDHCHETGIVRGMLCRACNTSLGLLCDDRDVIIKMVRYLDNAEVTKTCQQESTNGEDARGNVEVQTWGTLLV